MAAHNRSRNGVAPLAYVRSKNGVAPLAYGLAIHVLLILDSVKSWMPATSAGMTRRPIN
jgi:hypothetical protein